MGKLFPTDAVNLALDESDYSELKSLVFGEFGWPKVNVELSDDMFTLVIKKALTYLNTYAPRLENEARLVQPDVSDYVLPQYERINSVLDVIVSIEYLIGLGLPPQAIMKIPMTYAAVNNTQFMDDFLVRYASFDMAKRMYGTTVSFELIFPNIIRILPVPYMETNFVFVITVGHKPDLSSLDEFELNWLIRFCTARTARVLGRIRSKYAGVTLPVGGLDTDGANLASEGKESEDALLEELKSRRKFPESMLDIG